MSSNDQSGSSNGGPGRREVAHRLFAAEFDDASLSHSESDEERAPNYVVTPTGARVNRLFAVGVLTEKEDVNEDVLRGRIADPTGAFVTYAGQYQPDEMAYLERTDLPAFLALTGKARTFEPEDSDRVFTSVRPESINDVDGDTRDRWVVSTAEATLERVAIFAEALDSKARGDDLARELEVRGVSPSLAAGIPLAIDHYGTTRAYLEAVRRLAADALGVVTGDREEVRSLDIAPDEGGDDATLGPLPELDLPDAAEVETEIGVATDKTAAEPADTAEVEEETAEVDAETDDTATEPATVTADSTTEAESTASTDGVVDTDAGTRSTEESAEVAAPTDTAASTTTPTDTTSTTTAASTDTDTERTGTADGLGDVGDDTDETGSAGVDSGLGDFKDDSDAGESSEGATTTTEAEPDDSDGMYELPEEERQEVEAEFGTEFSTGSEVDTPGEADIDVPNADEVPDADEQAGVTGTDESADVADDVAAETDSEDSAVADTADAADVDLESAAVDAMSDLDDGDGADRAEVVAAVVDEYGVAPDAVEEAIQGALMSGQCYEPNEDQLKAI